MEHKDAAVLFVDISGSTAFFDRYGEVAGREMVERCLALLLPQLEPHQGRFVKSLGDGFLAIFDRPDDLVEAAVAIHTVLADDNDRRPSAARVRIHSGGHFGPAVFDESGDLFGDVVNVASRVQHVAGPDQIFVSADLIDRLPPGQRARTRRIGRFPLRGKDEEVELHEVLWKLDGATMVVTREIIREDAGLSLFFQGKVFELAPGRGRLTLGRIVGNDLVVDDGAVSREHAHVQRRGGVLYLVDSSTNGTYLRPKLAKARHLHRAETVLDGSGEFSLGRSDGPPIEYKIT